MKKSLLALAAIGAFTGAAQAQSSVTVYGILDVGYIGSNLRLPTGTTPGLAGRSTTSAFGQSGETTSRLGFRGTEDLGGGTRAFFTAELQLFPADYALSGNSNGGMFNRQTFVGLGQKGIGQFAFGTQYTPIHVLFGKTDPGQQNNIAGNVLYPAGGKTLTTDSYMIRQNNALTVQTDRFAGLQLSGMYSLNNRDATVASSSSGGNTNVNGYGVGLDYTWQKLNLVAAFQSFLNETNGQTTAVSGLPPVSAGLANTQALIVNGTNLRQDQTYVGGTYDFGILKVYAGWMNAKFTSTLNSNNYAQRSAQQIGVRGNVTKTIEAWASVGNGRWSGLAGTGTATVANNPTANFTGYQVGSNYWLSKRTNMYAIFGATGTSSTSGTSGLGANANQYAVGVRHTF